MAKFRVQYYYQYNGGKSWTGSSDSIELPTDNPNAQDFKTILMGKHSTYSDVRIASVEKQGSSKTNFRVSFRYKTRENDSGNVSTTVLVNWFNDSPSISDIEALVLGKRYNDYSVSITDFKKC